MGTFNTFTQENILNNWVSDRMNFRVTGGKTTVSFAGSLSASGIDKSLTYAETEELVETMQGLIYDWVNESGTVRVATERKNLNQEAGLLFVTMREPGTHSLTIEFKDKEANEFLSALTELIAVHNRLS